MKFVVYLAINKLNGKVYIGKTGWEPWINRWKKHLVVARSQKITTHLYQAMRSHGIESFDVVKIDETETNETACELERRYIQVFESHKREKGYNLTFGGDGVPGTPETREKISKSLTGRTLSEEHKAAIAATGTGKKHSQESKDKIAAAHRGMTYSLEIRKKVSAATTLNRTGTHHTEETRTRMRVAQKLRRSLEKSQKLNRNEGIN